MTFNGAYVRGFGLASVASFYAVEKFSQKKHEKSQISLSDLSASTCTSLPFRSRFVACESVSGLGPSLTSVNNKVFRSACVFANEEHTHNTRKISFRLVDGTNWADIRSNQAPISNIVVKADILKTGGNTSKESGCCACCKCPQPCSCPKKENGCCGCCSCPSPCGCPKVVQSVFDSSAATKSKPGSCCSGTNQTQTVAVQSASCCNCCKCPQPCSCPKGANGCCACCKCGPGMCGCAKKDTISDSGFESIARPYNPLSATSGNEFTLLVKKYENAKMGTYLHSLKQGDIVEVRGPNKQKNISNTSGVKNYVFIAGGSGITPLIQAAEYILENQPLVNVTFLTFNKSSKDVLLKNELGELEKKYPTLFRVTHYVENIESCCSKSNSESFKFEKGDRELMPKILADKLPQPPGQSGPSKSNSNDVMIMVCGRKEMTEYIAGPKTPDFKQGEVGGILKDLGFGKENVWKV